MAHKIEPSPSGRASCRACKERIAKDVLRFGEEFANQFSDDGGMAFRYYHLACAAKTHANELKAALAEYDGEVPDREALDALIATHLRPDFPYAERAPSGRARCRGCEVTIKKDELRVAFERVFDTGMGTQKSAAYVHPACLKTYLEKEASLGRDEGGVDSVLERVAAHSTKLSAEDLAAVREAAAG